MKRIVWRMKKLVFIILSAFLSGGIIGMSIQSYYFRFPPVYIVYEDDFVGIIDKSVPPPGYALEVNEAGEYRAIYKKTHYVLTPFLHTTTSRESALERAWDQFEYEQQENKVENWKQVEDKP